MSTYPFSDEQIHAFVDDQLDVADRRAMLEAIARDPDLAARVAQALTVRDLVRTAYREPPQPRTRTSPPPRRPSRWYGALAASLVAALGLGMVWQTFSGAHHDQQTQAVPAHFGQFVAGRIDQGGVDMRKVVLHVTSDDRNRMKAALDQVDELIHLYGPEHIQIEVVTNADGLTLLRKDVSPFTQRIEEMAQRYPNLTFLACRNTIARLKREQGIDPELIPQARTVRAAIEEIVTRLQEGWLYINV